MLLASHPWPGPKPQNSCFRIIKGVFRCDRQATSSLDQNTAEHFATTINQLKGKVGMIFITHAMPKNLQVDEIVNAHQELALLSQVVGELPKRIRQAFTLRRVYGLSQQEISTRMGVTEKTVEQLLTRAVRRCADALFAKEVAADRPQSMSERLRRRMKVP